MLKTRLIGLVLVKDGIAVQSVGFSTYLPIGVPRIVVKYLDRWGVDEVVLLHIDGVAASTENVRTYSGQSQTPLSVGGGIRSVDDVKRIIHSGADKVVMNASLVSSPEVVTAAATLFGSQCIVASIDARRSGTDYEAYLDGGRRATGLSPSALALRAETLGAGEIFVTSIEHDGSRRGYDLDLVESVKEAVTIPVITAGGAGSAEHIRSAIARGVSAVAVGNMLHYTEHSVTLLKRQLVRAGADIRIDSYVSYQGTSFDLDGRLAKLSDENLEHLRFRYFPEEVI
ncbi:MAG: HisA/HisF-related TIM barrel protein [Vicinamibacterales bacterium]